MGISTSQDKKTGSRNTSGNAQRTTRFILDFIDSYCYLQSKEELYTIKYINEEDRAKRAYYSEIADMYSERINKLAQKL